MRSHNDPAPGTPRGQDAERAELSGLNEPNAPKQVAHGGPNVPERAAPGEDHTGPDDHHTGPDDDLRDPLATTGAFNLPTMTGGIPVLEDDADRDTAHLPTEQDYARTRQKVTGLVIAVLTTLSAVGPLATDMYIPAFPQAIIDLDTTAARLQFTLTAFFIGAAIGQVVAGPLSDRLGRRTPLLVGIVLCLVASLACALAPTAELMLIARFAQGIGGGFGMVLGRAVIIDLTDGPELFRIMSLMQGIAGIAPIMAPLLGGLILLVGQWREIFLVIAGLSLLSLIGVLTLIGESLPPERRHAGGFRTFAGNMVMLLRRPVFRSYMLVNACSAFALMSYVSASSFVVQHMLGYSSTVYSISFAINSTGMMALSFASARLTKKHDPRLLMRIGILTVIAASAALLVGALWLDTPAWIVLPAFFFTVAPQGFIFGNGAALVSQEAIDFAGTGTAMIGLGFTFAASIAAPLVGIAGEDTALPMAIAMLTGALLCLTMFVIAGRAISVRPTRA